ncbi:MAG: stage II sporulation protein M [Candidatus Ornithomonoglobus sp.]
MIKKQYIEAITFFKEKLLKIFIKCIIIFVALFVISALAVKIIGLDRFTPLLARFINDGIGKDDAETAVMTWYDFLIHNGMAGLFILIVGFIPFIPVSAICLAYNGVLLGSFTSFNALINSHSILENALFGVAPHGILEYTVNCLVFAMGIYLYRTVTHIILKKDTDNLKTAVINCLRLFILFVLPALLIAGIIEANVTPLIFKAMCT